MHAEKCALGEHTCGEAVSPERRKPAMNAVVMHVGVDKQRYQHVAIQQPLHLSSSSTSIWRTVSAVMGFLPREITKRLRFAGRAERREPSFAAPGKDRRNNRFTAVLILQSSALASDFATLYRSGSRFTVSLMSSSLVQWCSGVKAAECRIRILRVSRLRKKL